MERLNNRWCSATSLDDFAEFGETTGESCFTDKGLGPTLLQQLLLAHYTVAVLEKVQENLKHFGFYRHELPRPPQLTACLIEAVVVKVIEHSTFLYDGSNGLLGLSISFHDVAISVYRLREGLFPQVVAQFQAPVSQDRDVDHTDACCVESPA